MIKDSGGTGRSLLPKYVTLWLCEALSVIEPVPLQYRAMRQLLAPFAYYGHFAIIMFATFVCFWLSWNVEGSLLPSHSITIVRTWRLIIFSHGLLFSFLELCLNFIRCLLTSSFWARMVVFGRIKAFFKLCFTQSLKITNCYMQLWNLRKTLMLNVWVV